MQLALRHNLAARSLVVLMPVVGAASPSSSEPLGPRIMRYAKLLAAATRDLFPARLERHQAATTIQMVVILASLEGLAIDE